MPKMPCLDCGVPSQTSRCKQCALAYAEKNPRPRQSPSARGYDHEWRVIRLKVGARDNYVCQYCGKKMSQSEFTVDHVVPLSKGGERLALSNLLCACRSCNSSKRDR